MNNSKKGITMGEPAVNLCKDCITNQHCCRTLSKLWLTEDEYKKNFADYKEVLIIQKMDAIYTISAKKGHTCPYWNGACGIYDKRPIECRLYPYTISNFWKWYHHVFVTFHSRTKCPLKERLLIDLDDARAMVLTFAREAFGNDCRIYVIRESLFLRLFNKVHNLLRYEAPM